MLLHESLLDMASQSMSKLYHEVKASEKTACNWIDLPYSTKTSVLLLTFLLDKLDEIMAVNDKLLSVILETVVDVDIICFLAS